MSASKDDLKRRAETALGKKAAFGEDIDLSSFKEGAGDIPREPDLGRRSHGRGEGGQPRRAR